MLFKRSICSFGIVLFYVTAGIMFAQLAPIAYRCLGQPDLRQNGTNRVQGVELYAPYAVALDSRDGSPHMYVADTRNHRVLAWQDAQSFQVGDTPALTLGRTGRGIQPVRNRPQRVQPACKRGGGSFDGQPLCRGFWQ